MQLGGRKAQSTEPGSAAVRPRDRLLFHRLVEALLVMIAADLSRPAHAGTIITANLPANEVIINISGTQDGSANYSGVNQAFWYEPFSTLGAASLLEYTMQPGTFGFRVIDPADASQMFPSLTSTQLSQIYTDWTYNSPWVTDYLVFDGSAATNSSVYQLFDGAFSNTNGVNWLTYSDAAAAYAGAITNGFYNLIRPGPAGRSGTNYTTSYTFRTAETLIFAVPDYDLGDNSGGVSVLIAPAAPIVPPLLAVSGSQGFVMLTWPTNANGFFLEVNSNLVANQWNTVTNTPVIQDTNYVVTLPSDFNQRLFRLYYY
jgi:hypothetical protein